MTHRELQGVEDEYAALQLRGEGWGTLSLLFFVLALSSRYLVALLPAPLSSYPARILLSALGVPTFAAAGLLAGLIGRRVSGRRGAARFGVFLNATALLLALLAIAAFFWILPSRAR